MLCLWPPPQHLWLCSCHILLLNATFAPSIVVSLSDCSGKNPLDGPLKEDLEEALALAERFTQQYNNLLRMFEERMVNTSFILDLLNRQFGWVSSLANRTSSKDNNFQVQTVSTVSDWVTFRKRL